MDLINIAKDDCSQKVTVSCKMYIPIVGPRGFLNMMVFVPWRGLMSPKLVIAPRAFLNMMVFILWRGLMSPKLVIAPWRLLY